MRITQRIIERAKEYGYHKEAIFVIGCLLNTRECVDHYNGDVDAPYEKFYSMFNNLTEEQAITLASKISEGII